MTFRHIASVAVAALAITMSVASGAQAESREAPRAQCFMSRDWNNWRASPDARRIYLRVGPKRVYRLDLASACHALRQPGAYLVNRLRGSNWICGPQDLNLSVAVGRRFESPCIVSGVTLLTPREVEALPRRLRP